MAEFRCRVCNTRFATPYEAMHHMDAHPHTEWEKALGGRNPDNADVGFSDMFPHDSDAGEHERLQAETLGEAEADVERASEQVDDAAEGTAAEGEAEQAEEEVLESIEERAEEVQQEAEHVEQIAEEVRRDEDATAEQVAQAEEAADTAANAADTAEEAAEEAAEKQDEGNGESADTSDTIAPAVTHPWFKDRFRQ